jgi:PAS domain S-box-containing protein
MSLPTTYLQILRECSRDEDSYKHLIALSQPAFDSQIEHYRQFVKHFPGGGVFVFDSDFRYRVVAGSGFAALGLTAERLEGKTLYEVFSPELVAISEPLYRRVLAGEITTNEAQYGGRIGSICGFPIIEHQLGVLLVSDVTDLRLTLNQQIDAKRFMEGVATAIPDVIYVYDLIEGRNVYINHEIGHVLGYTPDEIAAMGDHVFETLIHPDDLGAVLNNNTRFDGLADDAVLEIEYRMQHKDGSWRWLYSRDCVFRRDPNTRVKQILGVAQDVTERRQLQEELAEKNAELEYFFSVGLDLWCIADTDGYFHKLNRAWEYILGYTPEELQGRRFLDFVHPDDLERTLAALATLDTQTPILNFTNRYRTRDGQYRYIEWRSQPKGKFIYAAARDITERVQMETALQESETRYRSVVTALSEGIVLYGNDGAIQTCNAAAETILGLTVEQMTGGTSVDPLWRTIHEDGSPFPNEEHPAMVTLQTGKPVRGVVMGVHKPHDVLTWILVNAQPLFGADESQPYAVVASFTDITEMKWLEHEMQLSEARLRDILETMEDGVWTMEVPSYHISYMNLAVEQIFGRPRDNFMADPDLWNKIVHPDDIESMQEHFKTLLEKGKHTFEFRAMQPDGTVRWLLDRAWLSYDYGSIPKHIRGIVTDITQRKLVEQQRLELQIERQRAQLLSDFITTMSHELRTPLSIINTSMYFIVRQSEQAQRQIRAAQIEEQVQILNTIIDQLIQMTKLDYLSELDITPTRLDALVASVVYQYLPKKPEVQLVHLPANTPLPIRGHRGYITLALHHLLDNAVRFSEAGGHVTVFTEILKNEAVVTVQDRGRGISREHLQHIFNHFYKTDASRTQTDSGVGMGLAIVRQIMRLHGGHVSVDSDEGHGAAFHLHFPLFTE